MPTKKAVHFGAGNIGRGFLGQLYTQSGYELVFIDVVDEVVKQLNQRRSYPLHIVGPGAIDYMITNVRAVHGKDVEACAEEIATADIMSTAVGVGALKHIAPTIARGIAKRVDSGNTAPLNIIICENLIDASTIFRGMITEHLDIQYHNYLQSQVGLVETSIARMVPIQHHEDPLEIDVEAYCVLPVEGSAFVGPIPDILGIKAYDDMGPYVDRKLFAHNCAHAMLGYLGYLQGLTYVWEAFENERVADRSRKALRESGEALMRKHDFDPEEHDTYMDDLFERFHNKALGDTVMRVARDPVRKLGPHDRLVGAARLAEEVGVEPKYLALGIAAVFHFDHPDDPIALEFAERVRREGIPQVLRDLCEIDPEEHLGQLIKSWDQAIEEGEW